MIKAGISIERLEMDTNKAWVNNYMAELQMPEISGMNWRYAINFGEGWKEFGGGEAGRVVVGRLVQGVAGSRQSSGCWRCIRMTHFWRPPLRYSLPERHVHRYSAGWGARVERGECLSTQPAPPPPPL